MDQASAFTIINHLLNMNKRRRKHNSWMVPKFLSPTKCLFFLYNCNWYFKSYFLSHLSTWLNFHYGNGMLNGNCKRDWDFFLSLSLSIKISQLLINICVYKISKGFLKTAGSVVLLQLQHRVLDWCLEQTQDVYLSVWSVMCYWL